MLASAVLDERRMRVRENPHPAFERVLHVAHADWHGIRQATAYCPGHKLLIPADGEIGATERDTIARKLSELGITRIVFQGYSNNADALAVHLRTVFDDAVRLYAVTHVTTAQFDNYFEMEMQARLFMRLRYGILHKLGSVKPGFHHAFPEYWPATLLNFAPNVDRAAFLKPATDRRTGYIPLDVGWRKNMYTNTLGCLLCDGLDGVQVTNFPNGLESIADLRKLQLVGYLRGDKLLAQMAASDLVLLGTFAECQPTTQMEALAVGTPALTGPLGLEDFADDPLCRLTQMPVLDNPMKIARDIGRLLDAMAADEEEIPGMIDDHLGRRHDLAFTRYGEFLDL